MKQYIVICEGRSEFVYIQRLQSFLDEQSTGWPVPLTFRPIDNGGGSCGKVITGYKKQRRINKRTKIDVWVDYDLYQRNDNSCMDQYRLKAKGIPDFKFSYHNFEDFLVLHMDDAKVRTWRESVQSSGHLTTPLHSDEYEKHFENIMPGYRKGDLSSDFISTESLLRLKQNNKNPIISPPAEQCFGNFAIFLINQVDEAYPELLI